MDDLTFDLNFDPTTAKQIRELHLVARAGGPAALRLCVAKRRASLSQCLRVVESAAGLPHGFLCHEQLMTLLVS